MSDVMSSGRRVDAYVQTTRNNEANIRFSLFTRTRQLGRPFEYGCVSVFVHAGHCTLVRLLKLLVIMYICVP